MVTSIQQPSVSVIVPAYNQEAFIGRCLRSLLHQTMPPTEYEIIVVNDGSQDRTPYALSQFVDPCESVVQVIENSTNQGLPTAVNIGISASRAPYIVRVDSDDFVNTNFISFLHYFLEVNPQCDAVACDYLIVDDRETVIERISANDLPIGCGIMFRKAQLIDIGLYDEDFLRHEERELRIRFERKYQIHHLPLPLYRYRRHDKNLTNDKIQMEEYWMKLINKHRANDNH